MKFEVNVDGFRGETFEMLDQDRLTWAEADAFERAVGVTIGSLGEEDGRDAGRAYVTLGFLWMSVKRQRPTTTFAEMTQLPMGAVKFIDEPDPAPDPTSGAGEGADQLTGMSSEPGT